MGWHCKICKFLSTTTGNLLKHYKLWCNIWVWPCLHDYCPCTLTTQKQSALCTHLSLYHAAEGSPKSGSFTTFRYLVCSAHCPTEKDYYYWKSTEEPQNCLLWIWRMWILNKCIHSETQKQTDFKRDMFESHDKTVWCTRGQWWWGH